MKPQKILETGSFLLTGRFFVLNSAVLFICRDKEVDMNKIDDFEYGQFVMYDGKVMLVYGVPYEEEDRKSVV